jgi:hypothetical protein
MRYSYPICSAHTAEGLAIPMRLTCSEDDWSFTSAAAAAIKIPAAINNMAKISCILIFIVLLLDRAHSMQQTFIPWLDECLVIREVCWVWNPPQHF